MEWLWRILRPFGAALGVIFKRSTTPPDGPLLDRFQAEFNRLDIWYQVAVDKLKEEHEQDRQEFRRAMTEVTKRLNVCEKDRAEQQDTIAAMTKKIDRLIARVGSLEDERIHAKLRVDCDGVIREVNEAASVMFCRSMSELVGLPVIELMPFQYRQRHLTMFQDIVDRKRPMRIEPLEVYIEKEGREVPVSISLSEWDQNGIRFFGADVRRR